MAASSMDYQVIAEVSMPIRTTGHDKIPSGEQVHDLRRDMASVIATSTACYADRSFIVGGREKMATIYPDYKVIIISIEAAQDRFGDIQHFSQRDKKAFPGSGNPP